MINSCPLPTFVYLKIDLLIKLRLEKMLQSQAFAATIMVVLVHKHLFSNTTEKRRFLVLTVQRHQFNKKIAFLFQKTSLETLFSCLTRTSTVKFRLLIKKDHSDLAATNKNSLLIYKRSICYFFSIQCSLKELDVKLCHLNEQTKFILRNI